MSSSAPAPRGPLSTEEPAENLPDSSKVVQITAHAERWRAGLGVNLILRPRARFTATWWQEAGEKAVERNRKKPSPRGPPKILAASQHCEQRGQGSLVLQGEGKSGCLQAWPALTAQGTQKGSHPAVGPRWVRARRDLGKVFSVTSAERVPWIFRLVRPPSSKS